MKNSLFAGLDPAARERAVGRGAEVPRHRQLDAGQGFFRSGTLARRVRRGGPVQLHDAELGRQFRLQSHGHDIPRRAADHRDDRHAAGGGGNEPRRADAVARRERVHLPAEEARRAGRPHVDVLPWASRPTVNVSGYLNLKDAITPAQRDLAANHDRRDAARRHRSQGAREGRRIAGTSTRISSGACCRRATCRRSCPIRTIAWCRPAATSSPWPSPRTRAAGRRRERLLKDGGCTVDTLPNLRQRRRHRASLQAQAIRAPRYCS